MENHNSHSVETKKYRAVLTNRALGMFILFFGIVVIIAIYFTDTYMGKITNAIAGGLLCLIGGGMILKAMNTIKRVQKKIQ